MSENLTKVFNILSHWERQIKTTSRFHLALLRVTDRRQVTKAGT